MNSSLSPALLAIDQVPSLSIIDASSEQPARVKALDELANDILTALRQSPHFVVVDGFPPVRDRSHLINLARSLHNAVQAELWNKLQIQQGDTPLAPLPLIAAEDVSFTQVRIDPHKVEQMGGATRYSRTHQPLPPHTDSSYAPLPHELVAFQCLATDPGGGESLMVPVAAVVQQLDEQMQALLREPVYPFGDGCRAILAGAGTDSRMRYYRAQVERSQERTATQLATPPLTEAHRQALAALDRVLSQIEVSPSQQSPSQQESKILASTPSDFPTSADCYRFQLQPGQIMFMHNQRVFHGRTGLAPESDRLLYRVRLHLPGLDSPDLSSAADADAQIQPEAASAFASLASAEQLLELALDLEDAERWGDALQYLHQAAALAPNSIEILHAYGSLLLEMGAFEAARPIFQRCVTLDPDHYDSRLSLSSLHHKLGDMEQARAELRQATRRHPYILEEEPDLQKPTLLRLRGFGGAHYGILQKASGTCKKLLRGGHFATNDLVDDENYNVALLNIFENNSDTLGEIPEFDLILNTIACPDSKRSALLAAARFCDRHPHIPVINSPRHVLETTRERNSIRLNTLPGVLFPKTERLVCGDGSATNSFRADSSGDSASRAASIEATIRQIQGLGFVYPLIMRQVGTQTGQTVAFIRTEAELRSHLATGPAESDYYVIQYLDCRCRRNPIFHKMRMFFIDGTPYPVANVFRDSWNIHSGDRYDIMHETPWMQEEEQAYLGDPVGYLGAENFNRLRQIEALVGLDFFGVDFTVLRDGRLFIFELNAAMRHNFDHAGNFPYTEPYLEKISAAFEAMLRNRIRRVL